MDRSLCLVFIYIITSCFVLAINGLIDSASNNVFIDAPKNNFFKVDSNSRETLFDDPLYTLLMPYLIDKRLRVNENMKKKSGRGFQQSPRIALPEYEYSRLSPDYILSMVSQFISHKDANPYHPNNEYSLFRHHAQPPPPPQSSFHETWIRKHDNQPIKSNLFNSLKTYSYK